MGLLQNGATLAYSDDFRRVAAAAGAYVGSQVLAESADVPEHGIRGFFARQVLTNPEAYEGHFAWVCAVDPDIAGLGPSLTERHETAAVNRLTDMWTWLANFFYGAEWEARK